MKRAAHFHGFPVLPDVLSLKSSAERRSITTNQAMGDRIAQDALLHFCHCGRRPSAAQSFFLGPVKAHHHVNRAIGRRQPIRFLIRVGRLVVLNVQGQRTILAFLKIRQHGRVDQIPANRVLDQQLGLAVLDCDRPKRVHGGQFTRREGERVFSGAAVKRLAIRVLLCQRIKRLG